MVVDFTSQQENLLHLLQQRVGPVISDDTLPKPPPGSIGAEGGSEETDLELKDIEICSDLLYFRFHFNEPGISWSRKNDASYVNM